MSRDIYYRTAHKVAGYLAKAQSDNGSFPARTFYAETFSLLLRSHFQDEFKTNLQKSLAFAFDKPLIATHVGALPEVVTDNETGYLLDPKSPPQLAQSIKRLYSGNNGSKFSQNMQKDKKRFSWNTVVESIERFIKVASTLVTIY